MRPRKFDGINTGKPLIHWTGIRQGKGRIHVRIRRPSTAGGRTLSRKRQRSCCFNLSRSALPPANRTVMAPAHRLSLPAGERTHRAERLRSARGPRPASSSARPRRCRCSRRPAGPRAFIATRTSRGLAFGHDQVHKAGGLTFLQSPARRGRTPYPSLTDGMVAGCASATSPAQEFIENDKGQEEPVACLLHAAGASYSRCPTSSGQYGHGARNAAPTFRQNRSSGREREVKSGTARGGLPRRITGSQCSERQSRRPRDVHRRNTC